MQTYIIKLISPTGVTLMHKTATTMPDAVAHGVAAVHELHHTMSSEGTMGHSVDWDSAIAWNPRAAPLAIVRGQYKLTGQRK